MSADGVDTNRRRFLIAATTVIGGVGVAYTAVPFLASMQPSARARAAGASVEADFSKLEVGQMLRVEWRGKPVWIVRRTQEMIDDLASLDDQVVDPASDMPQQPDYAKNAVRSIKPEILILVGICTHLGCSPMFKPEVAANWKGGFFCPCHGSRFDLAGRVFKGVPAPINLLVPPHRYIGESVVLIGEDEGVA